jgi:glycine cleavage system H lipoate-binding protein
VSSVKRCFLVPPEEQACIWMAAGLLSYQLCNRQLECDNCPVDAVMHRPLLESPAVEEAGKRPVAAHIEEGIREEGFQYSRNHWWARQTASAKVRVGIESGLAQTLLPVKGIVFPSPHQHLSKGQACIWIVMDGGALGLESPLDGAIQSVNHDLIDKPHLLSLQPFDEGWLCEIESEKADAEAAGLQMAADIRPKYSADRSRFLASLASAARGKHPPMGITPADSGGLLRSFAEILGPARYIALLRQHYGWSK